MVDEFLHYISKGYEQIYGAAGREGICFNDSVIFDSDERSETGAGTSA